MATSFPIRRVAIYGDYLPFSRSPTRKIKINFPL